MFSKDLVSCVALDVQGPVGHEQTYAASRQGFKTASIAHSMNSGLETVRYQHGLAS